MKAPVGDDRGFIVSGVRMSISGVSRLAPVRFLGQVANNLVIGVACVLPIPAGNAPRSPGLVLTHGHTILDIPCLLASCHALDEAGPEVMLRSALQALVTKAAVIDANNVAVHGQRFVLQTGR